MSTTPTISSEQHDVTTTARRLAGPPGSHCCSLMRHHVRASLLVAGTVLAVILSACTTLGGAAGDEPDVVAWPDPSPSRPVVDLAFTVSEDLTTVAGRERVEFVPDLDICELVFRLWPNKPFTAFYGSALRVTDVLVGGQPATPAVLPAGAPDGAPGTLLEVPLTSCVAAGTAVAAELEFTLTLGEGADERIGVASAGDAAWFGTAFPLLAWERGRGWAREPAQRVAGEMATSETFRLRSLDVTAPSRYEVLGTGARQRPPDDEARGTTTHRFAAPAVRDVTVTVGLLDVLTREEDDFRLHVGAPRSGIRGSLRSWAAQVEQSIRQVSDRLGPLPYEDIWVSVLPDQTDGIEFPGALQFGDVLPAEEAWLVTHEVAHFWFHGLVGNNQARDPWLDESFATYVQLVQDGEDPRDTDHLRRGLVGEVGRPMSYWATFDHPTRTYVRQVYRKGGAALLEARKQAGADAFDAALVDYLQANAHRVAVPADVEDAFAVLPEAVRVLRRAGALEGS